MAAKFSDYVKKNADLDPVTKIEIGGSEWSSKNVLVTCVEVCTSVMCEASTCYVELKFLGLDDSGKNDFKLPSDFSKVKVGSDIDIYLGYGKVSDAKEVFKGYISSFDLQVDNRSVISLTIHGMDAKMWMMTSKSTKLIKEKHKYSDIVSDVYSTYSGKIKEGKNIDITGEVEFSSDLYQQNESDYEFLCRIAKTTGSMFFISLGKLYFINVLGLSESSNLVLQPSSKLYNVKLSASVWGIPGAVEIFSIDRSDYKKAVKGEATKSGKTIGDGKAAVSLTNNITKEANTIKIIDNTLSCVDEAKFLAQAIYNQREMDLLELKVKIMGYPLVELGKIVTVSDFGSPIDSSYLVTGIRHYCDSGTKRYITEVTMKTNRLNPQQKSLF